MRRTRNLLCLTILLTIGAGIGCSRDEAAREGAGPGTESGSPSQGQGARPADRSGGETQVAILAGGCFWCVESAFDDLPGVIAAVSGFTGGAEPNPTYEQVSAGGTGHRESVQVSFDSSRISYAEILD